MKTELKVHYFILIVFLIISCVLSNDHNNNNESDSEIDLNGELDKKLSELFSYYQNIIKNTDGDKKERTVIMKTLESKANALVKEKNQNNQHKNIFREDRNRNRNRIINNNRNSNEDLPSMSFLQNSMQEQDSTDVDMFAYQPFVWTNYTMKGKAPTSRRGHSAVLADTYLIVFGGCYMESKCFNDLYFLDVKNQNWISIPTTGSVPSPRQGHSAVLYGSSMWIYGGSSSEGYLNDLYSLNLETREWKKHYFLGAKNEGRAGHGAILDNNSKMIVFGGYSEKGYSNELFVINLISERFETPLSTGKVPSPRENFAMIIINGRIYIFGGFQEGGVLNDIFSIDMLNWSWVEVNTQGPTPPARQGMAATRVGNKIYVTGGCDYRQQICYTDTFILDTDSLWWTKIENSKSDLSGRGDFTLSFFRGHIYTFAGCEMHKQCFNNVFVMNINDMCPNKCAAKGECKEMLGCVCTSGWVSHDCSEKVKCKDDCNNNGICHNNAKCGCYPGWTGTECNTLIPCARNCTDFANGICLPDATCKCKAGFAGNDCGDFIIIGNATDTESDDPFKALAFMNTEKIKKESKKLYNETEYKVERKKCPNKCSGHGRCNTTTGMCNCNKNYSGVDCSSNSTTNSNNTTNQTAEVVTVKNNTAASRVVPKKKIDPDEDIDDLDDEDDKIVLVKKPGKTTEKQKLEVENLKKYKFGKSNEIYYQTKDCSDNCNKRGLCLNSTCFCDQGFTSSDCSHTYSSYLNQGMKFADAIKFLVIAFATGVLITIIVLMVKSSQKVSTDHLEFDES